jgi:acyl transferase domain-containing protein/NAD(P)H-dependent flavin oxidoreductase YrpB (nitropropane dioxygenase family)/NADP-dependent 3-hydroxy acid dehydrogenase YdfG
LPEFSVIGLTLAGVPDPAVAIAAARADGTGVLDLTLSPGEDGDIALDHLLGKAPRGCGVRCEGADGERISGLAERLSGGDGRLGLLVLTPAAPDLLRGHIEELRRPGVTVLVEATSADEAAAGLAAGADGLIARGNEAGGWVGDETSFILLQRLLSAHNVPIWAQGGIGLHTAAAVHAAGAAGVVLDAQLALTRESALPDDVKSLISRMDGSESVCIGDELGIRFRVCEQPPGRTIAALAREAGELTVSPDDRERWARQVSSRLGWDLSAGQLLPLGQDAAFAGRFAAQFRTAGRVVAAVRQAAVGHLAMACRQRTLDEAAPLAASHRTRYPLAQGPMTRVSDNPEFAARVAEAGGLPFLALALLRAPEVDQLLRQTRVVIGDRPWGVGILGFVPEDLREEQLRVIREHRPAYALIAGGRPDQALMLEQANIPTYLHVPSSRLLRLFAEAGARRFVFEGRECGGHVGPRTSFVLWDSMVDELLEALPEGELARCHVLFAGGIHDARSASMVAALAAPLADRGVKVGLLMGTAYLFADEAVSSGAIAPVFQAEAMRCDSTALLNSGGGHATRCAQTPYVDAFQAERHRLLSSSAASAEEVRDALEQLNLGRLRIATKGLAREAHPAASGALVTVCPDEQRSQGLFMIGQVAGLRGSATTIADLHAEVCQGATQWLISRHDEVGTDGLTDARTRTEAPFSVAIVGMSCLLPGAKDVEAYWGNIIAKVDAISEVPSERWDSARYFDSDPTARDKIYSRWGGFLGDIEFDPLAYGMPPKSMPYIESLQLLTLHAVRAALVDAGYPDGGFHRDNTSVILGVGGGVADLGQKYSVRSALPAIFDQVPEQILASLPEWTEDSFPGILLNVAAGRVTNRFDLGGVNYTVDAACASSLAAVYLAARELESRTSDVVIVGGADTVQNPFGYLAFSKTQALSPTGRCRSFDEKADGIVISEGIAILVLKRLDDAERDGDRIYAVIRGVAGSSDGRARGLTAPHPDGQIRALRRAYAKAGVSPAAVELIEAHGTGTVAGDRAEIETLRTVLDEAGAARRSCAIGSVKSMIGHTKCTAGVAGLVKVAKALHHKVLPPTLHIERPNATADLPDSPLYLNTEARPWLAADPTQPRRAGVSAFGFGGTNFHAVLEEYTGDARDVSRRTAADRWSHELLVWAGAPASIAADLANLEEALTGPGTPSLADLAAARWRAARGRTGARLAIVASSIEDLRRKLRSARERMGEAGAMPPGAWYADQSRQGLTAFLYPGQGSQYPGMLTAIALHFSEVRDAIDRADRQLRGQLDEPLASCIFPPPAFDSDRADAAEERLRATRVAQPALGAVAVGLTRLLHAFGVEPDVAAGHSYGEYPALWCAGAMPEEDLYALSEERGRCIAAVTGPEAGSMVAAAAAAEHIEPVAAEFDDVWVSNRNSPAQTVVSGTAEGLLRLTTALEEKGIDTRRLSVAAAFHSPLVAPARDAFAGHLRDVALSPARFPVFSNVTARPYPGSPSEMADILADHLAQPVRFADQVEAMYAAGVRTFVETGPRAILTGLVGQVLGDRPHDAIAVDPDGRGGLPGFLGAIGRLFANGRPVQLDRLFAERAGSASVGDLLADARRVPSSTTWLVNGAGARPLAPAGSPEPSPLAAPPGPEVNEHGAAEDHSALTGPTGAGPTAVALAAPLPVPPAPAGAGRALASDDLAQTLHAFQQLMDRFLLTQRDVMMGYLANSANVGNTANGTLALPKAGDSGDPAGQMAQPTEAADTASGDENSVLAHLRRLISERTGYPPELLADDADLEADLGIDSVKRVEVLGALQRVYRPDQAARIARGTDNLRRTKTLRGLAADISGLLTGGGVDQPVPAAQHSAASRTSGQNGDGKPTSSRFLLEQAALPEVTTRLRLPSDGVVLITDDGRGFASRFAAVLRDNGVRALVVSCPSSGECGPVTAGSDDDDRLTVTATQQSAETAVSHARSRHGHVRGLVHLRPLAASPPPGDEDPAASSDGLTADLHVLYLLARAAAADLVSGDGPRWLVAAAPLTQHAGRSLRTQSTAAGVAGFVKAMAKECPHVRAKTVGFPRDIAPDGAAELLLGELTTNDNIVEVSYGSGSRSAPIVRRAALPEGPDRLDLGPASVILITGGARGITSLVARDLARRYRCTLILLGRSPLPPAEEDPVTAAAATAAEIRAALIDGLRSRAEKFGPAQVEAACQRVLAEREIRTTLRDIQASGATAEYRRSDVRDTPAIQETVEEVYASHGRLDGIIHGAGVVEDRLLADKEPASFERVLRTKVGGALNLLRVVRPDSLRFLAFFASVAGTFGNAGQADYAAANEILNAIALDYDVRWPGRVIAVNWGPWDAPGMVTPEIRRQFSARGVELLAPELAVQAFADELRLGRKGDVQVVIGEGPWSGGAPLTRPVDAQDAGPPQLEHYDALAPCQPLYGGANGQQATGGAGKGG